MDDVFALAVINGKVEGARLALLGVQPLHQQVGEHPLAFGEDRKTVVLALVVDQEKPNLAVLIVAVVDGADAGFQRVHGVIYRNDNGNLRVENWFDDFPGVRPALDEHDDAADGGDDLHNQREYNPSAPEQEGACQFFKNAHR